MNETKTWRAQAARWWKKEIRPLLVMLLALCAIRSSFGDWSDVPTGTMRPTIIEGDRIWVNKLAYDLKVPFTTWHLAEWSNPKRGDIAVFFSPYDGTRLVKRVIGLPDDTIELRNKGLIINGAPVEYGPIEENRLRDIPIAGRVGHIFANEQLPGQRHAVVAEPARPAQRSFEPVRVPEGKYFMMGDNRDNSFDSRFWGAVERDQIIGRATSVVLSVERTSWEVRWHGFLTSLQK